MVEAERIYDPLPRCPTCKGVGMIPEVVFTEDRGPVPLTAYSHRCLDCNGTGLEWR